MIRKLYGSIIGQPAFRKAVMSTPVIRDLAWRFVAGENLDAGIAAIRALNGRGIQGTLNYVGTHVHSRPEAIAAATAAIAALQRIGDERVGSHLSLKLTQIGLDIDDELCRAQLRRVLESARETGVFVRIDMEEHPYVERTLQMFEQARTEYGADTVGIVIQSYLRERSGDLKRVVAGGSRVRLVKGGYWEPPSVAYKTAEDIDRSFKRDIGVLLASGCHAAIATHDARCIALTKDLATQAGLDRQTFEFQMLYGVRPDLQERLVREGYTVRCYVPFGGQWHSHFLGCVRRLPGGALRRLRERLHREPVNTGSITNPSGR
jgi:proline dehydrogenase